jgi:hypothetical protein
MNEEYLKRVGHAEPVKVAVARNATRLDNNTHPAFKIS